MAPAQNSSVWGRDAVGPGPVVAGTPTVEDRVATIPLWIGGTRHDVWIRNQVIEPDSAADAGLVLGYALAMALDVPCVFESPVSETLRSRIVSFGDIQRSWYPRLGSPSLEGPVRGDVRRDHAGERGVFFSGGLDSFHTAITQRPSLDALVFVVGADIPVHERWLSGQVSTRLRLAAAEMGLPLVEVSTNVRELSDLHADWHWYVGPAMCAIALALAPRFESILYSASHGSRMASGRRTDVEAIAGDTLRVLRHEGAPNRIAKSRAVGASSSVRAHLRVCWENRGSAYNCGRCSKCIRTMAELAVTGNLAGIETLPADVDLDAAMRTLGSDDLEREFLAELPASTVAAGGGSARPPTRVIMAERAITGARRRLAPLRRRIHPRRMRFAGATEPEAARTDLPLQCTRAVDVASRLAGTLRPLLAPHRAVALVGSSLLNAGDAAIWAGTLQLLERWQIRVEHVTMFPDLNAERLRRRLPTGPILISGGGNLGSLYPPLQAFRAEVLERFRDRPVIQLSQSIDVDARDEDRVGRQLRAHPDFTLCVRDEASRRRADELGVRATLCPDLAFALAGPELAAPPTTGSRILWLGRNDTERSSARPPVGADLDYVDLGIGPSPHRAVDATALRAWNWVAPTSAAALRSRAAVHISQWAWRRVGAAPAVVTERLHGHILCVLTGTPHVVIPDARGKIIDFTETWGTLGEGVHLVEDPDRALELACDLATQGQPERR